MDKLVFMWQRKLRKSQLTRANEQERSWLGEENRLVNSISSLISSCVCFVTTQRSVCFAVVGMAALVGCNTEPETPIRDSVASKSSASPAADQEPSSTKKTTQKESSSATPTQLDSSQTESPQSKPNEPDWAGKPESLIKTDSLDGWETINYGGEGECSVENGVLVMESGERMTGIGLTRDDLPTTNYEISLEARRVQGIDMFCGLTFPVDDSFCTLVVGGWAGATVGLSCIDELDASSNDTTRIMLLESKRWYRIRIRVLPEKIVAWIDDEEVVSQALEGHIISLRTETVPCKPFGLCTFQTTAETKNLQIRRIKPAANDKTGDSIIGGAKDTENDKR